MSELTAWLTLILPATTAGLALIMLAAPLGCLVLWRNMAFFSDTLAHGALLGLALASLLSLPLWLGMVFTASIIIALLWSLNDVRLPTDALLAGLSAASLSLGLAIVSFFPQLRPSMMAFLFGDLLAITWHSATVYIILCTLGGLFLKRIWSQQLLSIAHNDMAHVAGISTQRQRLYFLVLLATFTAMAIQAVGTLLVSSLLILPALTARLVSQSPKQMAAHASLFGLAGLVSGISFSVWLDIASGLCIVIVLAALFLLTFAIQHKPSSASHD